VRQQLLETTDVLLRDLRRTAELALALARLLREDVTAL
jgi:hypothetical protein